MGTLGSAADDFTKEEQEDISDGAAGADELSHTLPHQLNTMKQEIDALQIEMAARSRPWYRQASVMVAVSALIFTVATTAVSIRRTTLQDRHNAKVELRELIREMSTISTKAADLGTRSSSNPQAGLLASSLLTTDMIVLANQAADIVDEIPGEVTAAEYYAVASALGANGISDRVLDYYERGIAVAHDTPSHLALRRGLAFTYFAQGDVNGGREAFGEAIDAIDDFPDTIEIYRQAETGYTHLSWAGAELSAGECEAASQEHAKAATSYAAAGANGWDLTLITPQLEAQRDLIQQRCQGS
jgi:hypothetical protein